MVERLGICSIEATEGVSCRFIFVCCLHGSALFCVAANSTCNPD